MQFTNLRSCVRLLTLCLLTAALPTLAQEGPAVPSFEEEPLVLSLPEVDEPNQRREAFAERLRHATRSRYAHAYAWEGKPSSATTPGAEPQLAVRVELASPTGKPATVRLRELPSIPQGQAFLENAFDETDGPKVMETRGAWYLEVEGEAIKNPRVARFLLDKAWSAVRAELPPVETRVAVLSPNQIVFDSSSWTSGSRDAFELLTEFHPKQVQLTKTGDVRRVRYYGADSKDPAELAKAQETVLRYAKVFALAGQTPSPKQGSKSEGLTTILSADGAR